MRQRTHAILAVGISVALATGGLIAHPGTSLATGEVDVPTVDAPTTINEAVDANAATSTGGDASSEAIANDGTDTNLDNVDVEVIDVGAGAELTARVERFSALYEQARADVDALQGRIQEVEARIAELEAAIPAQKTRAAAGVRALYKFYQAGTGLVEFLLSADSFNDFIASVQYLDSIQEHNVSAIDRLVAMQEELAAARSELASEKREADRRLAEAERALAEAEAVREKARQIAAARAASEAAEIAAAIEASRAAAAAAADATFLTNGGNEALISVGGDPGQAVITPNEVEDWAARIDAYLDGSPLAGHGRTFAEAALVSGVDPRWSPAISCIESSKGRFCFKPHNAWGWGQAVWPDWDTAIRAHVSGLASGYGYSITVAAAKKYCPPHWPYWYSGVSSEMTRI